MAIWTYERLLQSLRDNAVLINGAWVPARAMRCPCFACLRDRARAAWLVLIGRADAFVWPEGQ